jgi:UDP-N-acetylmuramyl pentapeptide synthase
MSAKQIIIRGIASIVFLIKRKEFKTSNLKFLVFTGTVGKTTLRDAMAHTLKGLGIPVFSNKLGYSNELGILLTAMEVQKFSLKNPTDWLNLLKRKVPKEGFVCVELGADFYKDISWFLKRFTPFAVFISSVASEVWSKNMISISHGRQLLLEKIPKSGFVIYNLDDFETVDLIKKSNTLAKAISFSLGKIGSDNTLMGWSKNVYSKNINKIFEADERIDLRVGKKEFNFLLKRSVFEPQIYAILAAFSFIHNIFPSRLKELPNLFKNYKFSTNRLQFFKAKNGALIIEDSYKTIPFSSYWFIDMSKSVIAKKRILVTTEMRPLNFKIEYFYNKLAQKLIHMDLIYFLGPEKYFKILKKDNLKIKRVNVSDYPRIAEEIIKNSSANDLILLNGSYRYGLESIRKLLL